jgi:hypothetical protein
MSVWLKEWRAAFPLTPLFFLLLLGVWTAVPLQAQSETESGYPAPPGEQPIEAEEIWPDEPYPAPTPFTLIPLDTPESQTFPGDSASGYDPGQAPTFDGGLPSVGSTPAGNGQAMGGGEAESIAGDNDIASDTVSQALLWFTFSAALLIFIGALFWSIMLFNRRMTGGR